MMTPQTDYQELAKDAIFDALQLIFGLNDTQANKMFRFSWPSQNGSEKFTAKPSTDVCYIRFTTNDLSGTGYINHNVLPVGAYYDGDRLVLVDGRFNPLPDGQTGDEAIADTAYWNKDELQFEGVERMDTHRSIRAQLIFYGPHSTEYASRVRVGMERWEVMNVFKSADMAYVPNRNMPVSMDELIDGNWYSRTDVSLDFYQLVVYMGTVQIIEHVPDIHIITNS